MTNVYWLEFPAFACDDVSVYSNDEYWQEDLPPNCHYERVEVEQDLPRQMTQDEARALVDINGKP